MLANIQELQKLNNALIKKHANSPELKARQLLIKKLLSDPQCFFKISIETAFALLKDLGIDEAERKNVYSVLISHSNFSGS